MVDLDIGRVCGPPPRWRLGLAAPFLEVQGLSYFGSVSHAEASSGECQESKPWQVMSRSSRRAVCSDMSLFLSIS